MGRNHKVFKFGTYLHSFDIGDQFINEASEVTENLTKRHWNYFSSKKRFPLLFEQLTRQVLKFDIKQQYSQYIISLLIVNQMNRYVVDVFKPRNT